ncbi:transposase [Streptomyces sp. NPDC056549]|uniref:IS701 family transposase n=1 Tax=Streptomyces sp. NPDC056549 TaxID=3345864 RepID=UPI00369D1A9A
MGSPGPRRPIRPRSPAAPPARLQARGLNYVVGISTTLSAQPGEAMPVTEPYCGSGRRSVAKYPDKPRSVKQLVIAAGRESAKPVQWREGSRPGKGRNGFKRMYLRFVRLRILPAGREVRQAAESPRLSECWLLAEWPADEPQPVQFWLSDLPAGTPLTTLVRLTKLRWPIEHDYREMKQALGLAHFEGRTFNGWHHHVTLVSVAHAFCTLQRLAQAPKARRRPEPLPRHPRVADPPRDMDRRLPHLPPRYTDTNPNITKHY